MKFLPNLIRGLNAKIEVWRKHATGNKLETLENKLSDLGFKGKQGQYILSRAEMGKEKYEEQLDVIKYFEEYLGNYSDYEKKMIERIVEETGKEPETQKEVDEFISLTMSYGDLVDQLFKDFSSDEALDYFSWVEDNFVNTADRALAIRQYLDTDGRLKDAEGNPLNDYENAQQAIEEYPSF